MAGYCSGCGEAIPEGAAFCAKCGARVASLDAKQKANARGIRIAVAAGACVVVIVAGIYVASMLSRGGVGRSAISRQSSGPAGPVIQTLSLVTSDTNEVEPGKMLYWTFKVLPEMQKTRVVGKFEASGGSGNDVRVVLLTPAQFVKWRNREPSVATVYDSGRVRASTVDVALPEPGTYHLVFDNTFSVMSAKNVSADIRMTYER